MEELQWSGWTVLSLIHVDYGEIPVLVQLNLLCDSIHVVSVQSPHVCPSPPESLLDLRGGRPSSAECMFSCKYQRL